MNAVKRAKSMIMERKRNGQKYKTKKLFILVRLVCSVAFTRCALKMNSKTNRCKKMNSRKRKQNDEIRFPEGRKLPYRRSLWFWPTFRRTERPTAAPGSGNRLAKPFVYRSNHICCRPTGKVCSRRSSLEVFVRCKQRNQWHSVTRTHRMSQITGILVSTESSRRPLLRTRRGSLRRSGNNCRESPRSPLVRPYRECLFALPRRRARPATINDEKRSARRRPSLTFFL